MKIMKSIPLASCFIFLLIITGCRSGPDVIEHGIFAPSRHEYVLGQDGVCSIEFSDSLTLWTFADTITGTWKTGRGPVTSLDDDAETEGMLSNSIAWSEKITSENFRDIRLTFLTEKGSVVQFIKNSKFEDPQFNRFWALDGVRSGNRVYVFYLHVFVPDYRKMLEFRVLYTGLALWDIPVDWKPGDSMEFRRLGPLFPGEWPAFGASVMKRDGYIYLAGHRKNGESFPLSFARVAEQDIEKADRYEFLSSAGRWVKGFSDAGGFFGDISGECSLSYNNDLKSYILVYSKVFTGDIITVHFKEFNDVIKALKKPVYTPRWKNSAPIWPYSGKEIFSEGRKIYVIYIDPVLYQPMLLELRY